MGITEEVKLDGIHNFHLWSRTVERRLCMRSSLKTGQNFYLQPPVVLKTYWIKTLSRMAWKDARILKRISADEVLEHLITVISFIEKQSDKG